MDRKSREKEQRRNRILDAAEDVIFDQGIESTTMDEIAEQAELSKGTLYYYFENKHDLYFAVSNRGLAILHQAFAGVITEQRSGLELVQRLGEEYINFVKNHPHYFSAMVDFEASGVQAGEESSPMIEECEKKGQEIFAYSVRALQIGMQDGTIDSRYDPQLLAVQLWGSMRGITQLFYIRQKGHYNRALDSIDMNIDGLFGDFLDLLIRGMQQTGKTDEQETR